MTHSSVWHDSFICVTWLIHLCDMTHSSVWHDSFICVTWLNVQVLGGTIVNTLTPSFGGHDSFILETWLISLCDMTQCAGSWGYDSQQRWWCSDCVWKSARRQVGVCMSICMNVCTCIWVYIPMYMKVCMCARNGARIVYENLRDVKSVCLCLYMNVSTCIWEYVNIHIYHISVCTRICMLIVLGLCMKIYVTLNKCVYA